MDVPTLTRISKWYMLRNVNATTNCPYARAMRRYTHYTQMYRYRRCRIDTRKPSHRSLITPKKKTVEGNTTLVWDIHTDTLWCHGVRHNIRRRLDFTIRKSTQISIFNRNSTSRTRTPCKSMWPMDIISVPHRRAVIWFRVPHRIIWQANRAMIYTAIRLVVMTSSFALCYALGNRWVFVRQCDLTSF